MSCAKLVFVSITLDVTRLVLRVVKTTRLVRDLKLPDLEALAALKSFRVNVLVRKEIQRENSLIEIFNSPPL